jgi:broad specificity phosphatase PhoE
VARCQHTTLAPRGRSRRPHPVPRLAVAVLLSALLMSCSDKHPDAGPHAITLTFIRHGQSAGNASGLVDTSVPGPGLTALGRRQALTMADRFSANDYDGVFASTMIRTQQTASYLAPTLNKPVTVLAGLREIEGGATEGKPESFAAPVTFGAVEKWLMGHRDVRIPGSIDGNEFDKRFDEAVQSIYDSGDRQPVAFSHGAAIAVWTLMNVKNPRADLLQTQRLPNTGYVVVRGDPAEGWTLVDWNGTKP